MHELSIAMSIVELAEEEAERRVVQVNAAHLKVGASSGVVKEALLSRYEMSVLFLDGVASEARWRSPSRVASRGVAPGFSSGSIWAMTGRQPKVAEHCLDKAAAELTSLPAIPNLINGRLHALLICALPLTNTHEHRNL